MRLSRLLTTVSCLAVTLMLATTCLAQNSYDRELIVQDKTRAQQVEKVFKELMSAYENEDAREFLDYVSDERFRQDYITFTDALYSDFRNYEIHKVDYWIDKIVADHIKQFLFVHWEKRYEDLDSGRQLTTRGVSRFLFDEVDGDYLLIEIAGNHLFGGSLQEWREEVPVIAGQHTDQSNSNQTDDTAIITGDLPDLTLNLIDTYQDRGTGDISLFIEVKNIGKTDSNNCTLLIVSATGGSTYQKISPVPAGYSVPVQVDYAPANGQLIIDSDHMVSEANENNNTLTFDVALP